MMPTDPSALLNRVPSGLLIGGKWVDAAQGRTLDVENPATGKVIKSVADADPDDATRALDAAVGAADDWAATPARRRAEILRQAFDLLQERRDDIALLMTLEMGKPLAESGSEFSYGGEFLRWFSEEAVRITGRYGANPEGTGRTVVSRHPVGPCFLITPWNFPLAMATRKIGPALAAGCTVVVKPAALTPLTTMYVAQLLVDVGLPDGVVNVITTSTSKDTSAAILSDPRLRKLSFTGSTPVGVSLLKQAADNVLRTSMELGGNAPFLVFEDADLDKALEGAMQAKFRNMGEACTAANRFLVHSSVVDEFSQRIAERVSKLKVGDGTDPDTDIGPLIEPKAVQKVADLVEDAVSRGATVLTGGQRIEGDGYFYQPTVLANVPADAAINSTEIFGPVVAIRQFSDEDEAVRLANDTPYGLVGYAYTDGLARGQRMVERLETGMLGLNAGVISNAAAPFGGIKQSGLGREGGVEGINEYLSIRYTMTPSPV
jgi:succinate-semialdehyde dehydrogenase/glutarate-semialdehyde dehydrogenase